MFFYLKTRCLMRKPWIHPLEALNVSWTGLIIESAFSLIACYDTGTLLTSQDPLQNFFIKILWVCQFSVLTLLILSFRSLCFPHLIKVHHCVAHLWALLTSQKQLSDVCWSCGIYTTNLTLRTESVDRSLFVPFIVFFIIMNHPWATPPHIILIPCF